MIEDELWPRWVALCTRLGPDEDESRVSVRFHNVINPYASYHGRFYHDLYHIDNCLRMLDTYRELAQDPDAVEIALWYHNIVYEVQPRPKMLPSNEALSANHADRVLAGMKVNMEFREKVAKLIMATTHRSCNVRTNDEMLIADIDWSPVGWSWKEFERSREKIRREYGHLSDDEFKKGRTAWARSALERESQFYTPTLGARFNQRAWDNLWREFEFLTS